MDTLYNTYYTTIKQKPQVSQGCGSLKEQRYQWKLKYIYMNLTSGIDFLLVGIISGVTSMSYVLRLSAEGWVKESEVKREEDEPKNTHNEMLVLMAYPIIL